MPLLYSLAGQGHLRNGCTQTERAYDCAALPKCCQTKVCSSRSPSVFSFLFGVMTPHVPFLLLLMKNRRISGPADKHPHHLSATRTTGTQRLPSNIAFIYASNIYNVNKCSVVGKQKNKKKVKALGACSKKTTLIYKEGLLLLCAQHIKPHMDAWFKFHSSGASCRNFIRKSRDRLPASSSLTSLRSFMK